MAEETAHGVPTRWSLGKEPCGEAYRARKLTWYAEDGHLLEASHLPDRISESTLVLNFRVFAAILQGFQAQEPQGSIGREEIASPTS